MQSTVASDKRVRPKIYWMSFEVKTISTFERQLRRFVKKFPKLVEDYAQLIEQLGANPTTGQALGKGCYKIRLKISGKRSGKSGGARVITCVKVTDEVVYLLSIYDKSERASISDAQLNALIRLID